MDADLARLIVENALDYAIFTIDERGEITSWSPGAQRIIGFTADEAVGMSFSVLYVAADLAAGQHLAELERAQLHGRAEDTRWHQRKDGRLFWANGVTMRLGGKAEFVKVVRDETRSRLAEDQRVLLLNELNHRIKNTLTTVQSLIEHTLRSHKVDAAARGAVADRLIALAEAHNVLVKENWAGADLHAIVESVLAPHQRPGAFKVEGPQVLLSPQQAVTMSLALHELATNAVKYGALSVGAGVVTVTWNLAHLADGGRSMALLWQETAGPRVRPPSPDGQGFGTRLISRSFADAGGRVSLEYLEEGVRCTMQMPLTVPGELPMMDLDSAVNGGRPGGEIGASVGGRAE
jgi:PAS domain S-box-containing protein